ncbi:MAG: GNAT family N-acetyltransferase [Prolixibacteraceae bacterium]|nr:GNAT family N-acetyltransferase [Prolixibacteraceae bacterium]
MQIKIKSIQDIPDETIYSFLYSIDHEIVPPMSDRIDIKVYPKKIKKFSIGIAATKNEELVGMCVFYHPNIKDNYVYLTLLGVKKRYRKQGISKTLIIKTIEAAKGEKANGIKVQTWETAEKLIRFYNNFGFKQYGIEDNRNCREKSVLLKLDF